MEPTEPWGNAAGLTVCATAPERGRSGAPARVAENVAASDLTLGDDDLARIEEIAPDGGIAGRAD